MFSRTCPLFWLRFHERTIQKVTGFRRLLLISDFSACNREVQAGLANGVWVTEEAIAV